MKPSTQLSKVKAKTSPTDQVVMMQAGGGLQPWERASQAPASFMTMPGKTPVEELIQLPHNEMVQRMMEEDPELRARAEEKGRQLDYFFMECVRARHRAKLTQKDIAEKMGTTESAISRLESYYPGRKKVPRLDTLQRYAEALGCRLVLKLDPLNKKGRKAR